MSADIVRWSSSWHRIVQISSSSQGIASHDTMAVSLRSEQSKSQAPKTNSTVNETTELSTEEEQQLREMKARDREVCAHEQAHKSAAGGFASGGAIFEYQTGPDGKQYAVSGEVKIDTSPVLGNPEATVRKAEKIQRAATAPVEPSSQDLQVAAQAFAMEQEAKTQKRKDQAEEAEENELGILKSTDKPSEGSEQIDSINKNNIAGDEEAQCAICGGQHSGDTHTQANVERLNKVFELAEVSAGRASIFSVIA